MIFQFVSNQNLDALFTSLSNVRKHTPETSSILHTKGELWDRTLECDQSNDQELR
jgi:hypothetical protein